jgi:hypothetical protein
MKLLQGDKKSTHPNVHGFKKQLNALISHVFPWLGRYWLIGAFF